MAETDFVGIEIVATRLRTASGRVTLGDDDPIPGTNEIDMSFKTADALRISVERTLERRIGRFYSLPLAMTADSTAEMLEDIAAKLTAYEIWTVLNPEFTADDIPAGVKLWKEDAEKQIEAIVPKGKTTAVGGRDIILEDETLSFAADDPTTPNFAMSKSIPYGKRTT